MTPPPSPGCSTIAVLLMRATLGFRVVAYGLLAYAAFWVAAYRGLWYDSHVFARKSSAFEFSQGDFTASGEARGSSFQLRSEGALLCRIIHSSSRCTGLFLFVGRRFLLPARSHALVDERLSIVRESDRNVRAQRCTGFAVLIMIVAASVLRRA